MHNSFLIVARSLSVGTQWAKPFQGGGLAGVEILLMFFAILSVLHIGTPRDRMRLYGVCDAYMCIAPRDH